MENVIFDMKITNDGKEKSQSFECFVELKNEQETGFYGYGSNELEAKENCLEKIKEYFDSLKYTLESFKLDIDLDKSGAKAYLNRVDILFADSMARYYVLKEILERNDYKCTHEFSPMLGPATRFEKGCVSIGFSCIGQIGPLTIFNSQIPVLTFTDLDFENFEYFEQLVKGLFPESILEDSKEE